MPLDSTLGDAVAGTMKLRNCVLETTELVRAGTLSAKLAIQHIEIPAYQGEMPKSTWRKPVVGPPSQPFAELHVVSSLEALGWPAAWICKRGMIRSWEPLECVVFPKEASALHNRIGETAGTSAGAWDVFAWRDGAPLFFELKRAGTSDRVRERQLAWREAALRLGVPESAFALVEWIGASPNHRASADARR